MCDLIRIEGLCKSYKDFCLKDISLQLPEGSIMGFCGQNGAGKTSTIRAILGLITAQQGNVFLFGEDIRSIDHENFQRLGVVFDECPFSELLTPKDLNRILSGIYKAWDEKMFYHLLEQFDLPESTQIKAFSRGMKMKIQLAAALSHHPQLLILDEPTGGLDPVARDEFLNIFLEFMQNATHGILFSTHILGDIEKVADTVVMIHKGEILLNDNKNKIIDRFGVVRCKEGDFERLDSKFIRGVYESDYRCDVLVENKQQVICQYPDMCIQNIGIEELMVLLAKKGE